MKCVICTHKLSPYSFSPITLIFFNLSENCGWVQIQKTSVSFILFQYLVSGPIWITKIHQWLQTQSESSLQIFLLYSMGRTTIIGASKWRWCLDSKTFEIWCKNRLAPISGHATNEEGRSVLKGDIAKWYYLL